MRYDHVLLRCGLVGLAAIFSGAVGAADLTCTSTSEGYRCEAWPQGSEYRYHWHIAQDASRAAVAIDEASRRIRCPSDHASAIAVSVIAPAGYVETATLLLPVCSDLSGVETDSVAALGSPY